MLRVLEPLSGSFASKSHRSGNVASLPGGEFSWTLPGPRSQELRTSFKTPAMEGA